MTQEYASTGRMYNDAENTPVPFPAYRCPSTATEKRGETDKGQKLTYNHRCKLTTDHKDTDHVCICSRSWPHVDDIPSVST